MKFIWQWKEGKILKAIVHCTTLAFHFEKMYCSDSSDMVYSFEVITFLRRKVIPWENGVLADIVKYGTLEMIRYARQHGCPWSSYCGQEYLSLLDRMVYNSEIFNYLVDNGCPFAFDQSYPQMSYIIGRVGNSRDLPLLDFFVGRSSRFDNYLFGKMLDNSRHSTP